MVHPISVLSGSVASYLIYADVHIPTTHRNVRYAQEDLDKHPIETVEPPLYRLPPVGMPGIAFHFTDDNVHTNPWDPINLNSTIVARQMYRASVTGMDRKLGVLLDELDALGQ